MVIKTSIQDRNSINFRYGQSFTYDNITYAWRRQPYSNKLVVGVVENAIGKGFNVVDSKTRKPIMKNEEIRELLDTMWIDIKNSIFYERAYGKSLGMFWQFDDRGMPLWRAYDTNHYFAQYDEFAVPIKYDVINRVGGTHASANQHQIIGEQLKSTYELIIREDMDKGEGRSVLEPVWDLIFALSSLDEQGTYYAIRYGSGIRFMKIPEAKFTDAAFMTKINSMLRGAIGSNGVYALPYATINGVKEDFDVASESAVQIRFLELRDMLLGSFSAQTGIPREVLLGSQIGLRSSEKNEDAYFDYLQSIQEMYKPFFKWIVNSLNTLFEWYNENRAIDIEYIPRESLDEGEKLTMLNQKIDIASKAGFNVNKEWLEDLIGIPLEEKVTPPQLLQSSEPTLDEKDETDSNNQDQDDESQISDEDDEE